MQRTSFFEPYKIPGVWLWAAIQFLIPAAMFWGIFQLSSRPPIDQTLLLEAVLSGVGFVAFLNAEVRIGARSYDIKSYLYDPLIKIAEWLIEINQKRKAAEFWTDVKEELNTKISLASSPDLEQSPALQAGLDYLEEYFLVEVSPKPEKNYQERLKEVVAMSVSREQVRAIISLLKEVNRQDLVYALQRFQCSERLLEKYFAQSVRRNRLKQRLSSRS
ncbi:MAG: hypothetical protein HC878_01625 [Leptolyngbyaceae cyanobacterium SL_5_14]|nr:hypothetical protein [Leptolyngbyaceae cyanobacterium SL_5_14]